MLHCTLGTVVRGQESQSILLRGSITACQRRSSVCFKSVAAARHHPLSDDAGAADRDEQNVVQAFIFCIFWFSLLSFPVCFITPATLTGQDGPTEPAAGFSREPCEELDPSGRGAVRGLGKRRTGYMLELWTVKRSFQRHVQFEEKVVYGNRR